MKRFPAAFIMSILATFSGHAVILFDTGDPSVNTTAPTSALANSGWQYEGIWGGFLGTPIAPNYFISAAHISQAGANFVFQGATYTIAQSFSQSGSDLLIWRVHETFPSFAPLYSKRDEVGKHLVDIGRGTQRGSEVMLGGTARGWFWGPGDSVQRWGENDFVDLVPDNGHDLLHATFDAHVLPNDHPNECHLSAGDSGGGAFLDDNGTSKLAGINSYIDGHFYTDSSGGGQFDAAFFDMRGFWVKNDAPPPAYIQITGAAPAPSGFYTSRISSELAWICNVIADPKLGREGSFLTLTYSRLVAPSFDIVYAVEQSSDLASWTNANVQENVLSTTGDIELVKAKIDIGTSTKLFLRVRTTRP